MHTRLLLWPAIFCFWSFVSPPLSGLLRVNPKSSTTRLPSRLQLFAKSGRTTLARTFPDSGGHFLMQLPAQKDSVTDIFCLAPGLDTMYLQSVAPGTTMSALELLFPCEPDTTAGGEVICPKCRKDDQIYPMVYGDPIVITRHFDTTGKVSYERTAKKEVQADTVIRAARFYCRRDKITF